MKISTKGRYALRLMLDLALHEGEGNVTIKDISARQEISGKYLEQIITQLCRAGYVKSARGASGGYRLAYPAQQYTVGMILRLMEGSLAPVACLEAGQNNCPRAENCVTLEVWRELRDAIDQVVDRITLAELMTRCRRMEADRENEIKFN